MGSGYSLLEFTVWLCFLEVFEADAHRPARKLRDLGRKAALGVPAPSQSTSGKGVMVSIEWWSGSVFSGSSRVLVVVRYSGFLWPSDCRGPSTISRHRHLVGPIR